MAKEETPAYISYGEPEESPRKYWEQQLVKKHRMSSVWSQKTYSLWKRMEKEFSYEDLITMIDHWMDKSVEPDNFVKFYMNRLDVNKRAVRDYGWD